MVRVVRSLAGICACVFLLLFWVDTTKATTASSAAAEPKCQNGLQGVSAGTSILPSEYDDVEDKIRICGASPNCSTCVEMYRGDCGYVFPTNVTVIEEKRRDGRYLCACQTFACDLAWDPAGWNKKCFTKLDCIKPKPHYDKISLEQALCGGEDGPSVRFCPLTFSKQSYFSPGLVTSVLYEGENKGKKTPYRQYEIINKFLPANVVPTSGAANTSAQLPSHKGSITPPGEKPLHYVAYKKKDSLCLRYGGKREVNTSRSENEADFDTCIPIPVPERPVMYVSKSHNDQISGNAYGVTQDDRDAILKDAIYRNRAVFEEMDWEKYRYYTLSSAYRTKEGYASHITKLRTMLMSSSGIQYLCMQRKSSFTEACFDTKTAVELPRDIRYEETKCTMTEKTAAGGEDSNKGTAARFFPGYIFSRLKDIADKTGNISFAVIGGQGECRIAKKHRHSSVGNTGGTTVRKERLECEYMNAPVTSEYVYSMEKNQRSYEHHMRDRMGRTALPVTKTVRGVGTSVKLFDYHAMGEVVCASEMPQGDIEFDVSTDCGPEKSQCTGKTRGRKQFRVRKKPKTLRRYVMVGGKGERRRIRCDDKYSIDLYALSQGVLDKSVVHGNKFVLPKEYLMSTLSDNTEDPCYSSRSEIVYFYEDGGFVADADLRRCGNPITEYYAQGKAIKGCEYSYIRSDNYEPFLEEGNISGFSIVPLSKYEQGFCIDNFSRILFEPKSFNNGAGNEPQASRCFHKKVTSNGGNTNTDTAALTTEYRFPINKDSFAVEPANGESGGSGASYRKMCTFYKVEMWGGGEAAVREGEGGKGDKRSGRPGQYVSLLLDLKNIVDAGNTGTLGGSSSGTPTSPSLCGEDAQCKAAEKISFQKDKFSLLMSIGVGGQKSTPPEGTANGVPPTRGGDTVLYLCSDEAIKEQRAASSPGTGHASASITATSAVGSNAVTDGSSGGGSSISEETREKWPYKVINNPLFARENTQAVTQPQTTSTGSEAQRVSDNANCYEIARAVGGGSDKLGEPWYGPYGDKVLKYHRTISTNVLSSDKSGMKLLLGGEAMFTKIPVEVNMYDDNGGPSFATGGYLAQRSLPKERCNYIATPASDVGVQGPLNIKMTLIVPGMGGCWGKETTTQTGGSVSSTSTVNPTEDKPGAGRNGAVIITCERWGGGNVSHN